MHPTSPTDNAANVVSDMDPVFAASGGKGDIPDHRLDQDAPCQLAAHTEPALAHLADERIAVADHAKRAAFEHAQFAETLGLRFAIVQCADADVMTGPDGG